MPIKTGQLSTTGTAQRVSNAYGGSSANNAVFAKDDIPYKQVILQAESNTVAVGDSNAVTSSVYGYLIATALPVVLGPFDDGPIKLSDIWVIQGGGAGVIHFLGI